MGAEKVIVAVTRVLVEQAHFHQFLRKCRSKAPARDELVLAAVESSEAALAPKRVQRQISVRWTSQLQSWLCQCRRRLERTWTGPLMRGRRARRTRCGSGCEGHQRHSWRTRLGDSARRLTLMIGKRDKLSRIRCRTVDFRLVDSARAIKNFCTNSITEIAASTASRAVDSSV